MFLHYRLSPKIVEISNKNAANRENQLILHTLGSMTLARKRVELENRDGRQYSRGDMYQIAHRKKDGTFVNDEARQKYEQLHNEMQGSSENEAYVHVFGKEHPGYVRGIGLGVNPTHVLGFSSQSTRSTSSFEANAKMEKMQYEINSL